VLDNLSHRLRLGGRRACPLIGDTGRPATCLPPFIASRRHEIIHFAAIDRGSDRVAEPLGYSATNTSIREAFIECAVKGGVKALHLLLDCRGLGRWRPSDRRGRPNCPSRPTAPPMLMTEICSGRGKRQRPDAVILTHFNVAGADSALRNGQVGPRARTHLIKVAVDARRQAQKDRRARPSMTRTPTARACATNPRHRSSPAQPHATRSLSAAGGRPVTLQLRARPRLSVIEGWSRTVSSGVSGVDPVGHARGAPAIRSGSCESERSARTVGGGQSTISPPCRPRVDWEQTRRVATARAAPRSAPQSCIDGMHPLPRFLSAGRGGDPQSPPRVAGPLLFHFNKEEKIPMSATPPVRSFAPASGSPCH